MRGGGTSCCFPCHLGGNWAAGGGVHGARRATVGGGGASTRPGSAGVPAEVERVRVIPVLRALAETTTAILSVDTTKAQVAREALAAGAHIVNDTSALTGDPGMAGGVRDPAAAVVLMHRGGPPETMQPSPSYHSLFDEILDELSERIGAAEAAGIPGDRLLGAPGDGVGWRPAGTAAPI